MIDYACLAVIVVSAFLVVFSRNLVGAVLSLSAVGIFATLLFAVLGAPDDAEAEIVVGCIALPVLYMVAIGKIRTVVDEEELDERTQDTDAQ